MQRHGLHRPKTLQRSSSFGSLTVNHPCYFRNLNRTVHPATRILEPHESSWSLKHRTSSVPSGIGDVSLNVGVFPDLEDSPKPEQAKLESSVSLPLTPQPKAQQPRELRRGMFSRDNIPDALQALSYWDALEFWEVSDALKTGCLDKSRFFRMLLSITRNTEGISRAESDRLFESVDVDQSGIIDKEEFLGWVFGTHSVYCGGIRRRLEHLNERAVRQFCKHMDTDGNGQLDRSEFFQFMNQFAWKGMSRDASDELFSFIDVDRSGLIDTDEFLNWVKPDRAQGEQSPLSPATPMRAVAAAWGPSSPKSPSAKAWGPSSPTGSNAKSAIFEMRPGEPVVLEFTMGKEWVPQFYAIQSLLSREFDETQIKMIYQLDPNFKTCTRLVAKIGRGIVLWDRPSMITKREDPFVNTDAAFKWVGQVLAKNLPTVLKAHAQQIRKGRRTHSSSQAH
eukprot:gb/GFBE01065639.1/.p1 GENE.gb/GFBE01065639.1/~~gb/GFBE01065639.1/.p1  ORF type:complete len:450 (+),score=84.43 gb/GFBE01065639.1/:1-1350(+)